MAKARSAHRLTDVAGTGLRELPANAAWLLSRALRPAMSASSGASDAAASNSQPVVSGDYLINPEDVLDLYVYDVPELSREYVVNSAGNVTVPLLPKQVHAAGLSPDQFARALEQPQREQRRRQRALGAHGAIQPELELQQLDIGWGRWHVPEPV